MDDFRVGSVPSSEPYGEHQAHGSIARKRRQHHDGEDGREQDDAADTFELSSGEEDSSEAAGGEIADYYRPSGSSASGE
jgi:hypothetical protein